MLRSLIAFFRDAGAVIAAWALCIAAEHFAIGFGYRRLFVAPWEMGLARTLVTPIALAALLPLALVMAFAKPLFSRMTESRLARGLVTSLAVELAVLVALGSSHGRHFSRMGIRAAFVGVVALLTLFNAHVMSGVLARASHGVRALAGFLLATLAWCMDAFILPRLYPAFHAGCFVSLLAAAALAAPWIAQSNVASVMGLVLAIASCAWAPHAVKKLATVDNLRIVLLEHAPIMGRAVKLAAQFAPPPAVSADDTAAPSTAKKPAARSLDWTGDDIVLLSVDALRADHLGAYGYARATSPHVDALAAEGVVFDAAYCPTPHTSYSITSMMTGKYMRPLLALGLGDDSETWAAALRRYGYKTAAFYPPAVFFIDEEKFSGFEDRKLDFEYAKVEFADPGLRASQVEAYLQTADPSQPLFLWVHFFEPHEPYEMHPEHPFAGGPSSDVDAYDSEIAAADEGIGRIVAAVRAKRPRAVIIVTADHGEEFGDHGGRYHGTTVYEEQVRVPLVVVAPRIVPHHVATPVQTIDLLPTVISALGAPPAPRIRGRDDGAVIASNSATDKDGGFAFAETDTMTLVALNADRLICRRTVDACALFDVSQDPHENMDISPQNAEKVHALRALGVATMRETGRFEGKGADLPDALRRGAQGDVSAAEDVAALLDDARADIRLRAAEITFDLHAKKAEAAARREANSANADPDVAEWCALALMRMGAKPSPKAELALHDARAPLRRAAALAFAEQGDARGAADLAAWWREEGTKLEYVRALDVLAALAKIKATDAVPALVATLDDVRLRPFIADTLGKIGDAKAKAPLLERFKLERFVTTRPREAAALVELGVTTELVDPLTHHAGEGDPMMSAVRFMRDAKELTAAHGAWTAGVTPAKHAAATVSVPAHGKLRLFVMVHGALSPVTGMVGGKAIGDESAREKDVVAFEIGSAGAPKAKVELDSAAGIAAFWIVPEIDPRRPSP
ncbi:MAG: sulfatase-like hydrolase/transferase [Polyangiaceae bacterium]